MSNGATVGSVAATGPYSVSHVLTGETTMPCRQVLTPVLALLFWSDDGVPQKQEFLKSLGSHSQFFCHIASA